MRAFVGIDFSQEVKDEIYELQQKLRGSAQKGRWKHRDNFHLTLKFLDDISALQRNQIDEALQRLCQGERPFTLNLKGVGVFTGKESIRVLWLGLAGEVQELESIHKKMDQALSPLGFAPERRRFSPHITLGQDILFEAGFEEIKAGIGNLEFSSTHVERIHLFKSEQVQHKRIYTVVSDYPLLG